MCSVAMAHLFLIYALNLAIGFSSPPPILARMICTGVRATQNINIKKNTMCGVFMCTYFSQKKECDLKSISS